MPGHAPDFFTFSRTLPRRTALLYGALLSVAVFAILSLAIGYQGVRSWGEAVVAARAAAQRPQPTEIELPSVWTRLRWVFSSAEPDRPPREPARPASPPAPETAAPQDAAPPATAPVQPVNPPAAQPAPAPDAAVPPGAVPLTPTQPLPPIREQVPGGFPGPPGSSAGSPQPVLGTEIPLPSFWTRLRWALSSAPPTAAESILARFGRFDLVALVERGNPDLGITLIRRPEFTQRAGGVVVECADCPAYAQFLAEARKLKIPVLAADASDRLAAETIAREVLAKRRKALLILDGARLWRRRGPNLAALLEEKFPGRLFTVVRAGGVPLPAPADTLQPLKGTALGALDANRVLGRGLFPQGTTLADAADACVCGGPGRDRP